jgi:hypothetical protein
MDYRGSIPDRDRKFSSHHRIQTGSGAHPASYPVGTGGSFSGGKAAGGVKLTAHLRLVLRSRMRGAIPPLLYMSLWPGDQHQLQLYLTYN